MTEPVKSGLGARNAEHAAEQIAELVQECREGISDREAEAVAHAKLWRLPREDEIREDFADARAVRARLRVLPKVEAEVEVASEPRPYLPKRRSIIGQTAKKISPEPQLTAVGADGSTIAEAKAEAEAEPETKGGLPMVLSAPKLPLPGMTLSRR